MKEEGRSNRARVRPYYNLINRSSGMTVHYKEHRLERERQLRRLLGTGRPLDRFLVDDGREKYQIHEVWSNGILIIYDYKTHKKITIFAPPPYRIKYLYNNAGLEPPEDLIERSAENYKKGYNGIFDNND